MKQTDFKKLVREVQALCDNLSVKPNAFTAKGWLINATLLQVALETGEYFESRNLEEWIAKCKPVSINWVRMLLSGYILDYAVRIKDHPLNTTEARKWATKNGECKEEDYPGTLYMGEEDYNSLKKTVKEFREGEAYAIVPSVEKRYGRVFDGTWEECRAFIAQQHPLPEKIGEISEDASAKEITLWIKRNMRCPKKVALDIYFRIKNVLPTATVPYIEEWVNGYKFLIYGPTYTDSQYVLYSAWDWEV